MIMYQKYALIAIGIVFLFLFSSTSEVYSVPNNTTIYIKQTLNITQSFNNLYFEQYDDGLVVHVEGCNFNMMKPEYPVLPVYISIHELPFGSIIESIDFNHGTVHVIPLTGSIATDKGSPYDIIFQKEKQISSHSIIVSPYPSSFMSYHLGAGLIDGGHKTFLVVRIYPTQYYHDEQEIHFIESMNVTIIYNAPSEPLIKDQDIYDLLILSPDAYLDDLQPLVDHKQDHGVNTRLVGLREVYDQMYWEGRDDAEKIKYFIKYGIENWGIRHVLLVGGHKGQSNAWQLPVRYSFVVPPDEQEYPEQSFLSDLYFADIYNSTGGFSSWDSNDDDKFSVWNESFQDEMDLYPDVYLGRIPCRNLYEIRTMVNKIINYESKKADDAWFNNLLLVAGDSYVNEGEEFNEGEIISERAIELMPEFTPLKVYASMDDINRNTVNAAMNQGAGFAYFCGHGSAYSWSTHFPPATDDLDNWTTGYRIADMIPLKNKGKEPVTIVGGCHNGQFDITIPNAIISGIKNQGLKYFLGRFFFDGWVGNCWAWWLTSKPNGGAIATISNTGLGTHGEEDSDHNGLIDYLEVLNGWMELRFLELYGIQGQHDLGENHAQTIIEYLHWFLGNNEKMDTKMVQQWQLFGDPSLKIGGYI